MKTFNCLTLIFLLAFALCNYSQSTTLQSTSKKNSLESVTVAKTDEKINPWTGLPYSKVKTCGDALLLVKDSTALCTLCWKCCKKRRRALLLSVV